MRSHQAGNHTDYVARQYLGRLGKVDNGIVSVNIYGVLDGITFIRKLGISMDRELG